VVYLVIRERNFKDYNIAVFLGFFKYIGYLAFPIQMAYRYPALARFMAAHWATGAVHIVPVFGEHGALLEHWAFDAFYNYPLTIRRRLRQKGQQRIGRRVGWLRIGAVAVLAAGAMGATALTVWRLGWGIGTLRSLWPAVVLTPLIVGALTAALAGAMSSGRRMALAALVGGATGLLNGLILTALSLYAWAAELEQVLGGISLTRHVVGQIAWSIFLFALLGLVGGALLETRPPRRVKPSPLPAAEPAER
jgi:hypothetical protein